jgi:nicotinate-nucleotide adenylyltransferase
MGPNPDKLVAEAAQRTLYFGGSFNPIHHGHLICARAVAEAAGFTHVSLIPTAQPPHKAISPDLAPAGDRLEMCHLAIMDSPLFEVDSTEVERKGPSYTIDTIRAFVARGRGKVDWLIGADMLLYLPKWHKALELIGEVNFVVMARPGWKVDWNTLPEPFRVLRNNIVEAPMIDIRATDIRRRVAAGASIEYLTPPNVCRYIRQHSLYQQTAIL